jgi:hypothetical protein
VSIWAFVLAMVSRLTNCSSDLGDNIYFGDIQNYPTLWAHEIGHTMDHNVVTKGQDFSGALTAWTCRIV